MSCVAAGAFATYAGHRAADQTGIRSAAHFTEDDMDKALPIITASLISSAGVLAAVGLYILIRAIVGAIGG